MNKKGEESFLLKYLTRNILKRQILIDSIATNSAIRRSLFIVYYGMPNAQIRGCYCMSERDFFLFLFLFLFMIWYRLSNESTR